MLVAEVDGERAGVAAVRSGWLDGFYVVPSRWVLAENLRARRFYERRGWRENGATRVVELPPHPLDVGYSLAL